MGGSHLYGISTCETNQCLPIRLTYCLANFTSFPEGFQVLRDNFSERCMVSSFFECLKALQCLVVQQINN